MCFFFWRLVNSRVQIAVNLDPRVSTGWSLLFYWIAVYPPSSQRAAKACLLVSSFSGGRRTFSVYAFRIHQELSSKDTLPAYRGLPTNSLNDIHQCPSGADWRTKSDFKLAKRARQLIQSKLPKLTLGTRKSIRVGEVSAQKKTVFLRY